MKFAKMMPSGKVWILLVIILSFAGTAHAQPNFLQLNYFGLQDKSMVPIIFTTNPGEYVKKEDSASRTSNPVIYKLSPQELASMISAVASLKTVRQSRMLVYQILIYQHGTISSFNVQDRKETDELFTRFISIVNHNSKQKEIGNLLRKRIQAIL